MAKDEFEEIIAQSDAGIARSMANMLRTFNGMIVQTYPLSKVRMLQTDEMLKSAEKGIADASQIFKIMLELNLDSRANLFIKEMASLLEKEIEQYQSLKQTFIRIHELEGEYLDLMGIAK